MPRPSVESERSPLNGILSLSVTSIAEYLRKSHMDYQIIAEHKGVSLNLHVNEQWSLKSEDDNDFFPLFKGQTLESGLRIDELLPAYAKLMHHHEIAVRAPKKDRKSAKRMEKHVEEYVNKKKPVLRQELTVCVIDAMGRISRIESIDDLNEQSPKLAKAQKNLT